MLFLGGKWGIIVVVIGVVGVIQGKYLPLSPDAEGVIRSRVFPGLHLAVTALLTGDLATVLAELRRGLETAEHTAFVERLSQG